MLRVQVEVWPGGRVLQSQVIGVANIANVSELADVSDYEGYVDGIPVEVKGHLRSDGAWSLLRKALEDAGY